MKIAVTGINGFVGKILKPELEKQGHQVYGIDLQSHGGDTYKADITDLESIKDCIESINPDSIIHLAAVSFVNTKNPGLLYDVNVNGTINVLTSSISLKKLPKILLISSSQVYGDVEESMQPIDEKTPLCPINHYGASKAAIEKIAMAYNYDYGLPISIARPFNHIGRGQDIKFVVPKLIQAFKERKSEIELGNINVYRDFVDVREVVDAYISLIEDFQDKEIFNIASGKVYSIQDIITSLEKITGHSIEITINKDFVRDNEIWVTKGDPGKLAKMLGWESKYSLEEILEWIISDE